MASSLWQIGAGLAALGVTYPLTRKYDRYIDRKRKLQDEGVDLSFDSKRRRVTMPRFRTFSRRRRFVRRKRSRFVRRKRAVARRRIFTKRVKRVILKIADAKKFDNPPNANTTFREADGTSRVTYIRNLIGPLSQQGTTDSTIVGNSLWVKGFSFRGQAALSQFSANHQGALLRVSMVWSKQQLLAGSGTLGTGFLELNSGTTTALTQTAGAAVLSPEQVPVLFETTGVSGYVGNGYVIPFDRTSVKLLKSYTIVINPAGNVGVDETNTTLPTPFNFWFPLNKMIQFEDPLEGALSSGRFAKYGTYYLVIQAITDTNTIANVGSVEVDYRLTTFYRDP